LNFEFCKNFSFPHKCFMFSKGFYFIFVHCFLHVEYAGVPEAKKFAKLS
jgi:hypothetical protein